MGNERSENRSRESWSETGMRASIAAAHALCRLSAPLSIDRLRRFGTAAGDVAWRRNSRAVRTTRTNIDAVYPDQDRLWRQHLARESIRHTAMTLCEAAALWTWPLPRLAALVVEARGAHLLHERSSRGLLVLAPHFGNWEFLGYYLSTFGPLTPLYERPASKTLDAALLAARSRLGSQPAPDTTSGLRRVLKVLRDGGMVAVLPDQVPRSGVTAPFFGHPAATVLLVHKLLRHANPNVVVATATRTEGGFVTDIDTVDEAIRDPDATKSAAAMNAAVEAVVRRDPAQYQWEYKRFRFPGQPNIYA